VNPIDSYLKSVPEPEKSELERIRSIALAMLPSATEVISYRMPTIKLNGKPIIGFDVHKNHIGIYPYSGSVIAKIPELARYERTKSAIREKLDDKLPDSLIKKIIEEKLKQINAAA
jgi:uncharacterized protein YdhG (YjbR/CyaY superfamily)